MRARAPAKLNLALGVGRIRADGLHELRSLFCPLELADRIEVTSASGEVDEVVCPGVAGPNLAAAALAGMRERGWTGPPLRVEITKRIPVAAGLGGGSADAAAVLRLAHEEVPDLEGLAQSLGADVPSQLHPRFALVSGSGDVVKPMPGPRHFGCVLLPFSRGLSAAEVYREADRLGTPRGDDELEALGAELREAAGGGASPLEYADLLVNDLEEAAITLMPEVGEALSALRDVGAIRALVAGSGPTAVGLFEDIVAADRATADLPARYADAIVSAPATSDLEG